MDKNMPLERSAQYRAGSVNVEKRTADFVISSEAVDSYRTVFLSNWDLERYKRNPVVTYQHKDHDANPDLVIGTSDVFLDENKRLVARMTFENGEDNPLAEKVFRKVKNGILRGASIWADPKEYRWGDKEKGEDPEVVYFTRSELLAWSIVSVQSNPEALARNAKYVEDIRQELKPVSKDENRSLSVDTERSRSGAEGTENEKEKTGLSNKVARLQLEKYKSKVK